MRPRRLWSSGLALEVRDLVGLGVGLLLRAAELFLGVALALLLLALAAQAGVIRQVACSLLRTSGHLVHDAHELSPPCGGTLALSVPDRASGQTDLAPPRREPSGRRRLVELEPRRVVRGDPGVHDPDLVDRLRRDRPAARRAGGERLPG